MRPPGRSPPPNPRRWGPTVAQDAMYRSDPRKIGPSAPDLGRTARSEQAEVGSRAPVAAWSGGVSGAAERHGT